MSQSRWNQKPPVPIAGAIYLETSLNEGPSPELAAKYQPLTSRMVESRRKEFVLGRTLAEEACRQLTGQVPTTLIGVGKGRNPLWPEGIQGSIAHNRNRVAVCAWKSTENQAIGIDWESKERESKSKKALLKRVCLNEVERSHPLVTFSAKESLYKALYPHVGDFKGFEAASVEYPSEGKLKLELTEDWGRWKSGSQFSGQYIEHDDEIFTVVILPLRS